MIQLLVNVEIFQDVMSQVAWSPRTLYADTILEEKEKENPVPPQSYKRDPSDSVTSP
jgi:hypothetical protein